MSTLVENVAKVTAAHAALKEAIAAKGVAVPDGAKLTDMPALVEQIQTDPVPTNPRAVFSYDDATSIVVPKTMVVADMTSATNLHSCFVGCTSLTSLTLPDGFGRMATDLTSCFNRCTSLKSLTLPDGFGRMAIKLDSVFYYCTSLTSLTLPDGFGRIAENLYLCFYHCDSLTSLTLPDGFGRTATNMNSCIASCPALTSLTLPDGFGRTATLTSSCLGYCPELTTITGNPNFKSSIDLSRSTKLTHDSIMVVINGLQTVTSSKKLTLGSTNLAKLTDEEKKIATDKGWTLA